MMEILIKALRGLEPNRFDMHLNYTQEAVECHSVT